MFILIQYQFLMLHNLVWDETIREVIGDVIIYMTSSLLAMNLVIIVVVSLRRPIRMLRLKCIRRKAIALYKKTKPKQSK